MSFNPMTRQKAIDLAVENVIHYLTWDYLQLLLYWGPEVFIKITPSLIPQIRAEYNMLLGLPNFIPAKPTKFGFLF